MDKPRLASSIDEREPAQRHVIAACDRLPARSDFPALARDCVSGRARELRDGWPLGLATWLRILVY